MGLNIDHLGFVLTYEAIKRKITTLVWSSRLAKDTSITCILDILFKYHFKKCDTAILHFLEGFFFPPKALPGECDQSVPWIHSDTVTTVTIN